MFVKRNPIREATAGKNSSPSSSSLNVAVAHLRLGSYYEIDSSILPQRSPEQLKSIRIVMVSKITASAVSFRYPSMHSLRSYFDCKKMNRNKPEKKRSVGDGGGSLLPVLDESHVMSSELAGDLLYRRITPHEVSMDRNSWNFWVSSGRNNVSRREMVSQSAYNTRLRRAVSPEGKCWSELRSGGMIKWGRRLRVQYKSRHDEYQKSKEGEENSRVKDEEACKEEIEEDDDDGNETEEAKEGAIVTIDGIRKRKMIESSTERRIQKAQKKETQIVVYQRRKSDKKFIDRWSLERYKLAEKNMLKVMKEKNAVFGNSILRPELRSEARKLIGDTGLLDHLLKHMAGKVAPGGQDRFMRKHNADGAMEYWLESSDLIHIRKEAGVEDPYWTPPPGWKLGDNPTQDPVCAGEIREIKEELASLKSGLEKLASKKEEEELVIMTTPNSCVTSQNVDHDNLMTPAKEIYADLLKKKYKIEDQLLTIGETLREMEEDMGWLKKTVDENCPRMPDLTETPLLLEDSPKVNTLQGEVKEVNNKGKQITEPLQNRGKGKKYERSPLSLISNTGFRICKPVGSFAWPTLPSLTTATDTETSNAELASSPSHRPTYPSTCPVKPLAAKRPLGLPFTFSVTPPEAPTKLFARD
ncbi:Protein DYAD [Cardamine amara subsp. amara]|uniref:Protein DYAD n=1 Tax=Cardamine amara subsp. amara TaxID=228776 RepID=A0ABD1BYF2_CARAN